MKILVADKFPESGLEQMKAQGWSVRCDPDLAAETLPATIGDANVLVVRSTQVTRETIEAAPALSLILRAGAGVNTIDVAAASERGIYVANCPGKNSVAVAELTLALILGADRRLPQAWAELRAGQWNKKEYSKSRGVMGQTVGIIGLGSIGREVVERLRPFGVEILAWSRSLTPEVAEEMDIGYAASVDDLLPRCDVVTIHVAQTDDTRNLLDAGRIGLLKPGCLVVNTSRGGVIDEPALLRAMDERNVRAALDVYADEPKAGAGPVDLGIIHHANFVGTPHIGASTDQAQGAIADEAMRVLEAFSATGKPPNCVNIEDQSPASCQLIVRHYDRVGVLAGVLDSLSRADVNVEEVENLVFKGAKAAVATIRLAVPPTAQTLAEITGREHVLHMELKEL